MNRPLRLGDILLMRRLLPVHELEAALERQRKQGGRLGENLIALGLITREQLTSILQETPSNPLTVRQTGISRGSLLALLLKFMRTESCETLADLSTRMKLPIGVLQELIDEAANQRTVEVLGSVQQGLLSYNRYTLTDIGRSAAAEALAQSQYLGPAPVSLDAFQEQVRKQAIVNENLQEDTFRQAFGGMNIPPNYVRKLLPAVRSGRTVLLYGPPGNGKTSIGTRIATMFRNVIYVPYAIEVGGQIIKVYDTGLHKPYAGDDAVSSLSSGNSPLVETFDARWVACKRPVAMAGGELTVEMLDLGFDPVSKFYDAPLHMKALNGLFLIDDFGRQRVSPTDLLNRWIVPMESRIDYLKLNTGFSFVIPIDELVIFSTNLAPADLMDPAFLRRIPYKIECTGPSIEDYRNVFITIANSQGLTISTDTLNYIVRRLQSKNYDLAYFQPKFLCDQFSELCRCFDLGPVVTREIADEGLENLYVDLRAGSDPVSPSGWPGTPSLVATA